jgi:hypothetical protein
VEARSATAELARAQHEQLRVLVRTRMCSGTHRIVSVVPIRSRWYAAALARCVISSTQAHRQTSASLSQSHSVQSENQQLRTLIRDVLPTVEEQRAQVCAVRAAH